MISAESFCAELDERGFTFASGVPCSYFGGPIALLSATPGRYVAAANEGGALAVAAGACLAGRRAYVMLQNSGFGNVVNPLTSLVMTYRIPVLAFVSLRGWPDGTGDEPQHEVMGRVTQPMVEMLGLPHWILRADDDEAGFRRILDAAADAVEHGHAPIVLVQKGAVGTVDRAPADASGRVAPGEALRVITEVCEDNPIVATTGYTSRELFATADRPANFYMQGSMGHASALALGLALARPDRSVVVLDGDGAALMHLGTMSVVGHEAPRNLVHVVLDNGMHESTGGQLSTSATTAFEEVALATGYRTATRCTSPNEIAAVVSKGLVSPGPHLCVVPTAPRTGPVPPRATNALSAVRIRERFTRAL